MKTRLMHQLRMKSQSKGWLDELESGELPQITPPGFPQGGVFNEETPEPVSIPPEVEFEDFTTDPMSLKDTQVKQSPTTWLMKYIRSTKERIGASEEANLISKRNLRNCEIHLQRNFLLSWIHSKKKQSAIWKWSVFEI